MLYITKIITFDIFLLKSEISISDYLLLYEDTNPSNVVQVGFITKPLDVGDDDPSQGDSWVFKTSTVFSISEPGIRSFFYTVFDQYGNTDFSSDSFNVDICLIPVKPIISDPVYDSPTLTFQIGQ